MAGWFAKLMQKGHARSPRGTGTAALSLHVGDGPQPVARDARFDVVVQTLRDRAAEDRAAREKRQRGYRQSVESDPVGASGDAGPSSPMRLHRFRTRVPCRATPEARALLDQLRKQFPRGTVSFVQVASGRQAVMLTRGSGSDPKQIGWIEHQVQADPARCNVRHQGLAVETDGGSMLVLRFRYPATAVRMSAARDGAHGPLPDDARRREAQLSPAPGGDGIELPCAATGDATSVDFAEIRPALDLRPSDKGAPPRLVWVSRTEAETMDAVRSRDYEAFYVRFKLEVLAGIWSSLSGLLASAPGSRWHQGSHYTVTRELEATSRKIHQRTVDDGGRVVDIGANRVYDAAPATDILLLYLDGDILADFADIYFTLQTLGSADAYFLKEELFTVIRRFWAGAESLASRYGSELAAVVRMSQRAVPMPAQAPLLRQDWINLRQELVDRYGEGGRKATGLAGDGVHRPRTGPIAWPFATFPAGEVNVGLRVVYRQEWRHAGAQRGEVLRTPPPAPKTAERAPDGVAPAARTSRTARDVRRVETIVAPGDTTRSLDDIVADAVAATVASMKWPLDLDGCINTGVRGLAATSDMGLEPECRESSHDTCNRLSDTMLRMTSSARVATPAVVHAGDGERPASAPSAESPAGDGAATCVYSRLQHRYEVLTRPAEIQNVVLVAEKLPSPAEIDLAWVRRHDWILAKVLLDESFRDALETIGTDAARRERDVDLQAKRDRLCEHVRANILHYQRAIWQHEDPQQRRMRYRKSGRKVPLEWRFELESGGALTLDELGDRLTATCVDGQFATYSAGREADLDQVIDPAGPIGYYGNYAVYRMRPELGSADLFSMLHFFKSPYLRPDPETGEPEVADPAQIRIADDPAVTAASDEVIDRHRDEMFQLVPELRRELARTRTRASDGSGASAVDVLGRQAGSLRRHYATYLFRRERTRRTTLDTDGVVIDVVRDPAPVPAEGAITPLDEVPAGYRLVLESARGIRVLGASGRRDAEVEWAVLRGGSARAPSLRAGAGRGAVGAHDAEGGPMILTRDDGARMRGLVVGRAPVPEAERVILARDDDATRLTAVAGLSPADAQARVIVPRGDGERAPRLHAGAVAALADDVAIRARDDGASTLVATGAGASGADDRVMITRCDEERTVGLRAGRARGGEAEALILARGDGAPVRRLDAGRAPDAEAEPMIVARDGGALRLTAIAGVAADREQERMIVARGDGAPKLGAIAGGAVFEVHERVIVAGSTGGRTPGLRAGAGTSHAHERLIVSRVEEWLRPSMIAG